MLLLRLDGVSIYQDTTSWNAIKILANRLFSCLIGVGLRRVREKPLIKMRGGMLTNICGIDSINKGYWW